jgi:peptide/nickel transport system permease protein
MTVSTAPSVSAKIRVAKVSWRDGPTIAAAVFLLLLVVLVIAAPLLGLPSPSKPDLLDRFAPPVFAGGTWEHPLGADDLGRDVLARLIDGAKMSMLVGLSVVAIAGTVGVLLGLLAGYHGGWVDTAIMRTADAQLAFPGLLLVLLVVAFVGPSVPVLIIVLSIYGWMIYARLVRGVVLEMRESPAIQSAKLIGCSTSRILRVHILPGLYSLLLTQAMVEMARTMIAEASLSYLGLGVQAPQVSWGLMVADGQRSMAEAWAPVVFPGALLALSVLSINLIANWLRVMSDPELKAKRFAGASFRSRPGPGLSTTPAGAGPSKAPDASELLSVQNLEVVYHTPRGDVPAVDRIRLDVKAGETVAVVGESGSGKSTTVMALMGLISSPGRVEQGQVTWEGRPLDESDIVRLRGREISMIFQDPMTSLNPLMSVGSQISEVLVRHRGMSKIAARHEAEELLRLVGVPSPEQRLKQFAYELSGGLRQRVMIAVALAADPKLILADEPTTALDATIQAQILEVMSDIRTRLNVAIVLVTHDLGVVARFSDRVVVMYAGEIVENATTQELFARPKHRYTQALIAAVPSVGRGAQSGPLPTISGAPPAHNASQRGCPFEPRCAHSIDACVTETPELVHAGPTHSFNCWNPNKEDV